MTARSPWPSRGEPSPLHSLDRYREIVSDWEAFLGAIRTPEAVTLRTRLLRIGVEELRIRLEGQGFQLASIDGLPDYLRVKGGPGSVAQTLEHWLGLLTVQQAVMALPSLALDPQPGERVLDLCAAPGGKTSHLAELMSDRGALVAVDPKEKRIRGLLSNIYRLGHSNVLVIAADGRSLPGGALFDRVLVDAPCSAEGNVRRQGGRLPPRTAAFERHVTSLQRDLLGRAIELTRPGGTIVYSTCTFAPEENEAVLAPYLLSGRVALEPIPLPLPHAPGIPSWKGQVYPPTTGLCWRVYPHHMDSGGLFMARLRRLPSPPEARVDGGVERRAPTTRPGDGWGAVPLGFPGESPSEAQRRVGALRVQLEQEHGFVQYDEAALRWMVRRENIWAHTTTEWPLVAWSQERPEGDGWRVVSLGVRGMTADSSGAEIPSNAFLVRWGKELGATRNIHLEDGALLLLLEGGTLPLAEETRPGRVALLWNGVVLGRGRIGREGLVAEIPKASRERLRALLSEKP